MSFNFCQEYSSSINIYLVGWSACNSVRNTLEFWQKDAGRTHLIKKYVANLFYGATKILPLSLCYIIVPIVASPDAGIPLCSTHIMKNKKLCPATPRNQVQKLVIFIKRILDKLCIVSKKDFPNVKIVQVEDATNCLYCKRQLDN